MDGDEVRGDDDGTAGIEVNIFIQYIFDLISMHITQVCTDW